MAADDLLLAEPSLIVLQEDRRKGISIGEAFLARNPHFIPSRENFLAMVNYLEREKLEISGKTLDRALKVLTIEEKVKVRELPSIAFPTTVTAAAARLNDIPHIPLRIEPLYTARELTREELSSISPAEMAWHMEHNFDNYARAMVAPSKLEPTK